MKRFLIGFGYGIVGLVVATGLTLGTYAIAGQDLSRPAVPIGAGKALSPHKQHDPTRPPDRHHGDRPHETLVLNDLPVSNQVLTGSSDGGNSHERQTGGGTSSSHSDSGDKVTVLAPTPQPSPEPASDDPSPAPVGGGTGNDGEPVGDGSDD